MIDVIIGGSIAASIIYSVANYQTKEVRKINLVFKNIGYKVGKLAPRIIEIRKNDEYAEYVYEVPPGLIDDPKLSDIITKDRKRPVTIKFKEVLILRVYNSELHSIV